MFGFINGAAISSCIFGDFFGISLNFLNFLAVSLASSKHFLQIRQRTRRFRSISPFFLSFLHIFRGNAGISREKRHGGLDSAVKLGNCRVFIGFPANFRRFRGDFFDFPAFLVNSHETVLV